MYAMANTSKRGFASMDPRKQREIASKGGRAAHAKGTAHEFTPEEARIAGRKGGESSRGGRKAPLDVGSLGESTLSDRPMGNERYGEISRTASESRDFGESYAQSNEGFGESRPRVSESYGIGGSRGISDEDLDEPDSSRSSFARLPTDEDVY
jgi:hypothetical protein